MFCPNCGCWNPDDSQNCSACATALQQAPAAAAPAAAYDAPVSPAPNTSFVARWRKIATAPILLILAVAISVQAVLNFQGAFDSISWGFELFEYDFLFGLMTLFSGIATLSMILAAAGLWMTYLDGVKKDNDNVNPMGIKLTTYALMIQLISTGLTMVSLIAGEGYASGVLGALMSSIDDDMFIIMVLVIFGLVFLYYGLLYAAANSARNAVETKTPSVNRAGGASAVCYVYGALAFIGLLAADATDFASILSVAVFVLQGLALSKYKAVMSK